MSYPPEASRSCHEADGRSDRSGGSGGAAGSTSSGGVYGPLCGTSGKWPFSAASNDPQVVATDRLLSNWKKWSLGLDYLLQDSEGVALFKSYLQYEGCSNLLDFWFACQGFRSKVDPSDHRKISQLIKAIYRTYIRGSSSGNVGFTTAPITTMLTEPQVLIQPRTEPIRLRTETRRMIAERISRKHALDQTVFDPAQAEVEQFLRTTAYPAFLKSDVYVDFLQSTLEGSNRRFQFSQPGTSWSSCLVDSASGHSVHGLPEGPTNFPLSGKILPTLEEDRELNSEELSGHVGLSHLRPASSSCPPNPAGDSMNLLSSAQSPPWHCPHCSQYHSQGHQTPCTASDPVQRTNYPPPHLFPPGFRPPFSVPMTTNAVVCSAPLTVENLQMTRFYRAELSLQQHTFSNHPTHSQQQQQHPTPPPASMPASFGPFRPPLSPPPALIQPQDSGDANRPRNAYYYYRGCDQKPGAYPRAHLNYMYTHWADAVCPPPTQASDPRSGNRLPSQPPNPYHISYAPVSARDSERHSLSSEARTDDTHSHTDSSHDGGGTRLWHSFGHRHPASHSYHQSDRHTQQHQPQPQQQSHNQSTAAPQPSAPAAPSLRGQSADYPHLAECSECVCTHHRATVTSLSSPIPFVTSPRPAFPTRDGLGHSQRPTGLDTATGTSMTQSQVGQRMQPVQTTDHQPGRSHTKHQRRAVRRGVSGWRSGDRSKSAAVPVVGDALPEPVTSKTTVSRSHNLAERDPQAFFRVLSEKLQHVLDNQLATERLDRIMTDTSPVPPHSTGDQTTDVLTTADKQPDPTEDTTIASSASMAVSTAAAPELAVPTTVPDARQSGLAVSSLLQRPWADRLLAAARIHENTRDNAQAILEDHCSRIWAASADRTPTSSGSGSGGAGGGEVGVLGSAGTNTLMTETDNAVRLYELGCRSLEPAFHLKTHQPVTHAKQNEVEDGSRSLHSPRSRSSSRCSEVASNPLQSTRSRHHALLPSGKEGEMWPSDSMVAASGVQPGAPLGQQSGKECTVDSQPAPDSPSSCMSSYVESSASPGMLPTTLPCGRLPNMESSVRSVGLQVAASSVLPCITTPHSVSSSSTTTSVVSVSTPGLPVSSPSSGSPHSLVIGYYLGDDPVPYRSLWPSAEITLGQFKQLIPKKKGSFRYFFKKLSNEFGSGVVHQEITNDSCLLPLWEGKVVAKVERIE